MTVLGIVLLVAGATLVAVEAHVPTLGAIAVPGVAMMIAGAVLVVSGAGAGLAAVVITGAVLGLAAGAFLAIALPRLAATRRRQIRTGAEGLIGHVGVLRNWEGANGQVLVDGALWRACRSWADEDGEHLRRDDPVVVERLNGLTLAVRRAEEWEVQP
jgi:membrane-bound serine protease (ClpP class)